MEEPAFRLLRQGLPQHLHGRFVYQAGAGSTAKVLARGLGALTPAQQLEQLMEWLAAMASQLAGADGKTEAERQEELRRQNEAVLSV